MEQAKGDDSLTSPVGFLEHLQQSYVPGSRSYDYTSLSAAYEFVSQYPGRSIDDKLALMDEYRKTMRDVIGSPGLSKFEDPLLQYMLSIGLRGLMEAIAASGFEKPRDLAFGTLPVYAINAVAIPAPTGGAVIILNGGLLHYLLGLAEAIAWFLPSSPAEAQGRSFDAYARSRLDTSGVGHALFSEVMVAYLRALKQGRVNPPEELRSAMDTLTGVFGYNREPSIGIINTLGETALAFILAHELSHLLLGHLERRRAPVRIGHSTLPSLARSSDEELAADRLALSLTLKKCQLAGLAQSTSYFGVEFLFASLDVLERALATAGSSAAGPTVAERRVALRKVFAADYGAEAGGDLQFSKSPELVVGVLWERLGELIQGRANEPAETAHG